MFLNIFHGELVVILAGFGSKANSNIKRSNTMYSMWLKCTV